MLTKQDLEAIEKIMSIKLKPVNTRLHQLNKKLDLVIRTFDKDIIETKHRVDRIDTHLSLPPLQLT